MKRTLILASLMMLLMYIIIIAPITFTTYGPLIQGFGIFGLTGIIAYIWYTRYWNSHLDDHDA